MMKLSELCVRQIAGVIALGWLMSPVSTLAASPAAALAGNSAIAAAFGGMSGAGVTGIGSQTITNVNIPRALKGEDVPGNPLPQQPAAVEDRVVNEFQIFTQQAIGQPLPIFGAELFKGGVSTFAPIDNVPVSPDYMIGPGDEIVVKGWGAVDIDFTAMVNRNGTIDLPKVGSVSVAGVRYEDLQKHVKKSISKVFRNFEINVSLGKLRSIQVFVVGQAKRPGVYTISALSSLVNTLFSSGGPSANGSMRQIEVKRNGKLITQLDLYDFLLKGDKTKDVPLQPGDIIYIPPVGAQIAVYGGVKNPAIFELKEGKGKLAESLELAGGLTTTAAGQKVLLERIEGRLIRKVEELELTSAGLANDVRDGDVVRVLAIGARFDNAVTLRGNVSAPGRHPWRAGMKLSDLIPSKDALIVADYWVQQNMAAQKIRQLSQIGGVQPNGVQPNGVQPNGVQPNGVQPNGVQPNGVQPNGVQPNNELVKLKEEKLLNEVKHGVAEINWDYAVIERLNTEALSTELITFNLGKAIAGDETENKRLMAGDTVTIFSKEDMQVPVAQRSVYVKLEGEIVGAGVYKTLPGETLRKLLQRVGGISPDAYLFGAEFSRESVRVMQQKKMAEMVDRMEQSIRRNSATQQKKALTQEDIAGNKAQQEAQLASIEKMRSYRASGRMVLEISPNVSANLNEIPDLVLEDGDRLYIPARPSVVNVMGMVYNENSFIHKTNKYVGDYLQQAGGPTREADPDRLYVVRADGSVLSAQHECWFLFYCSLNHEKTLPGDTIIVPEILERFVWTKELKDWSQIFYQFALGATSVKVLRGY